MRFLTLLFIFSVCAFSASAQHPDWTTKMQDPNTNFFELQAEFNAYWEGKEHEKGDGYKPFKRWEYWAMKRLNEDGTIPSGGDRHRVYEQVQAYNSARSMNGNWEQLGPILDGTTTRDDIPGVGRINAIEFHPTDPMTLYAGAPSGGLWRTTNGGQWWEALTDDLPTLGVSAVVVDHTNPDVIYIGTGDRDSADAPGLGVYKSTDGGETWEISGTGMSETAVVGMMLMNPQDNEVLFAATNQGVYRTTNSGASWQLVSSAGNFKDIKMHPTNPDIIYAAGTTFFHRSTNGGSFFQAQSGEISFSSRSVIGVSPDQPDWVYLCGANSTDFRAMYRSTDAGETWEEMSDSPNILGWSNNADGGQAWYDLAMTVNPEDASDVYVAGIRVLRSRDAGVTWQEETNNFVHVDQHFCAFSPHTNNFWLGNDGGIYEYEDNQVWKDQSNGMVVSQMYKLGQSPFTVNNVLTGFQDNGTSEWTGTKWERRIGADGMECMYDHQDQDYFYGAIQLGQVRRTGPGFAAQTCAKNGLGGIDEDEEGLWVTPYTLDIANTNTMYVGYHDLWKSTNIKDPIIENVVWEKVTNNLTGNPQSYVNSICQSPANTDIMYISKQGGNLFRNDNINDSESEWVSASSGLPGGSTVGINDIEAHPFDEDVVYVAFLREIYKSVNRGASFEIMTDDSFPNLIINSIIYDKNADEGIYIGTEMGVYYKDATMDEWIPFSSGMPPTLNISELEIFYGEDLASSRLRAASYGRGLWESDLFDSETYYFPAKAFIVPEEENEEIFGSITLEISFYKNLNLIDAETLTIDEIEVINATITDMTGGPSTYTITIEPQNFGEVTIYVPNGVATGPFGVLTEESDVLSLAYLNEPEPLGIYGPGGVGDTDEISYWFIAEENMLASEGGEVPADGSPIGYWGDVSGNSIVAVQNNSDQQPEYVASSELFNGFPAIRFVGDNDFLRTSEVTVKENITSFLVASAQNNPDGFTEWNASGWLASAREPNGFIVHPWEGAFNATGIILDNNGEQTVGLNTIFVPGIGAATIHGMQYYNNSAHKYLESYVNGNVDRVETAHVERDAEDQVEVNFGRDFDDRYGAGEMAEQILYVERLRDTHTLLVRNYLASKYKTRADGLDRYTQDDRYYFDVAGIGQMSEYDKHLDAQGRGIVRMSSPSDIDNGEFLLWGSGNGSMQWAWEGNDGVILSGRVGRTWGYEETGDLGEVLIQVYDTENTLDLGLEIGIIHLENPAFQQGLQPEFVPLTNDNGVWSANVDFSGVGVFTIGVQPVISVSEATKSSFAIFPNPASHMVNVNFGELEVMEVEILDNQGRKVYSERIFKPYAEISLDNLASGIYTLKAIDKKGRIYSELLEVIQE